MNKEYIEREAALRAILGQPPDAHYPGWYADSIKEIPAADVAPVVHGYWINTPPYRAVNGSYKKAQECSVCDAFYVSDGNAPYSNHPYCAECGAKMDGAVRRWTEENDGTAQT